MYYREKKVLRKKIVFERINLKKLKNSVARLSYLEYGNKRFHYTRVETISLPIATIKKYNSSLHGMSLIPAMDVPSLYDTRRIIEARINGPTGHVKSLRSEKGVRENESLPFSTDG